MDQETVTAEIALRRLLEGNRRFAAGQPEHPHQTSARRAEVLAGQHPVAIILGCSDSRVPAEIIFDQGIGDLFVVRTAGNVLDGVALGSIEYAAEHLHVPLLVVLGHQNCGAVVATVSGEVAPGHIASIVKAIRPVAHRVKGLPGDVVENTVRANVQEVVAQVGSSQPILAHLVHEGRLVVVGACYSLETGVVSLL